MSDVGLDEVLAWFFLVSAIPRTSGNEKTISDTLRDHYERKGLDVLQDEAWNLVIRKPAHAGQGDRPGLILQAHLDMVGEKTSESRHDFATDPIQIVRDGDVLHAQDTALGADDGIGVAICLALLDSEEVHHPYLEILLTTQEETGLEGAKALTGVNLRGQYFLNIDGEREGVFLCSGAGGSTVVVSFPLEEASHTDDVWELRVSDLRGGHSGLDIDKGRINGIAAVAVLLVEIPDVRVALFDAPGKFNAINREVHLVFSTQSDFSVAYEEWWKSIADADPDASASLTRIGPVACQSSLWTRRLLEFLASADPGVREMSSSLVGVVETSSNLGLVEQDEREMKITASVRSSSARGRHDLEAQLERLAAQSGGRVQISGSYPAWEYQTENPLREQVAQIYSDLFHKAPLITGVHGGLECGVLHEKYPDLPMLALGPSIADAHTPRESVSIPSIENLLKLVLATVERIE